MADPTNKVELLETMQSGYASFEALLAAFSDEQLISPGVNGDWSVKDILVHIATWQARAALSLEFAARGEKPRHDFSVSNEEQMHQFNASTFAAGRSRPLAQVQADLHTSYQQMQAAVEALSEGTLFDAGRFAWMDGDSLWKIVGGNTFEHYEEHTTMIEEWQARAGA